MLRSVLNKLNKKFNNLKFYSTNNVLVKHNYLEIIDKNNSLVFYFIWLRDHCRCKFCYNLTTYQRKIDFYEIQFDIRPESCTVEHDKLIINWNDGHVSEFSMEWLKSCTYNVFLERHKRMGVGKVLWDAKTVAATCVKYENYMGTESGQRSLMESLVKYGVGFVDEAPATVEATEGVVRKISHVQHTLFGGMWTFSDSLDHSDTAYSREALGAHNDNTYFTESAGLQIFHCLSHEGEGGETLLIDGFTAANKLQNVNKHCYHRLTTTLVEAEYMEPGQHHSCIEPILKLDPVTGDIFQIRYNMYDRAPLTSLPPSLIQQHYLDLLELANIIRDKKLEWWIKLKPGTICFIDNYRVLHGRASYTGNRTMCGCYVGRTDYLSRARILGLI